MCVIKPMQCDKFSWPPSQSSIPMTASHPSPSRVASERPGALMTVRHQGHIEGREKSSTKEGNSGNVLAGSCSVSRPVTLVTRRSRTCCGAATNRFHPLVEHPLFNSTTVKPLCSCTSFFALVGLSSPVKACLFEDEGDVQTSIAFTFQIEISCLINWIVIRIVHRIVSYHTSNYFFNLLYIVLYIQL